MKAAVVTAQGLALQEVPVPKPGPQQILVKLRAIGLNRADLGVAAGHAHGAVGGIGAIPGLEAAGEIAECGSEVPAHLKPGMRVMGGMGASYAEYAVVDWGRVSLVPDANMSWEVAATLPIALQTMHNAVVTHGLCAPGAAIMIQGASSGVGLITDGHTGLICAREAGWIVISPTMIVNSFDHLPSGRR